MLIYVLMAISVHQNLTSVDIIGAYKGYHDCNLASEKLDSTKYNKIACLEIPVQK